MTCGLPYLILGVDGRAAAHGASPLARPVARACEPREAQHRVHSSQTNDAAGGGVLSAGSLACYTGHRQAQAQTQALSAPDRMRSAPINSTKNPEITITGADELFRTVTTARTCKPRAERAEMQVPLPLESSAQGKGS